MPIHVMGTDAACHGLEPGAGMLNVPDCSCPGSMGGNHVCPAVHETQHAPCSPCTGVNAGQPGQAGGRAGGHAGSAVRGPGVRQLHLRHLVSRWWHGAASLRCWQLIVKLLSHTVTPSQAAVGSVFELVEGRAAELAAAAGLQASVQRTAAKSKQIPENLARVFHLTVMITAAVPTSSSHAGMCAPACRRRRSASLRES